MFQKGGQISLSIQTKRKRSKSYNVAVIEYSSNQNKVNEIMALKRNITIMEAEIHRKARLKRKFAKSGRFIKEYNSDDD